MLTQAGKGVAAHPDLCEFFRQTSVETVFPVAVPGKHALRSAAGLRHAA